MGPYTYGSMPELDGILAGAGYHVRSSDLRHVADSLERLESAMVGGNDAAASIPDSVHYNPSDLTAWVDTILSDLTHTQPCPPLPLPVSSTWTDQVCPQLHQTAVIAAQQREEESGIRLVHLLMNCAEAVQHGDNPLAQALLDEIHHVLTRVNPSRGIGKVAAYFSNALRRRIHSSPHPHMSPSDHVLLYHHFYESSPYLKFAHFTSNQAILESFEGHDRVHVIDFNLMEGLQWPALIQALALRPNGPPFLRLTAVGPPSSTGRDELRDVGLRLAELARSVRVRFAFRGIAANRLDDVRPWMLHVAPGEAVAVNAVLQLHRLLGDQNAIDSVLGWVSGLRPKIVTMVEQEADHNKPGFLDRFAEALFYYSTVFDSLEAGGIHYQKLAEAYLEREICNVVCSEGSERIERHEPLVRWMDRLGRAGLRPVHLGSNAFKQASMLLTLFSAEGYCVEEVDGCLTLGWHGRPLFSASAWCGCDDDVAPVGYNNNSNSNNVTPDMIHDNTSTTSTSNT
ncbi:protein SLENDER RICE1-LIKE 1-like [Typha latifolia]|uniref:protein SLENDER RICE1-LIKE 1-like n=1 Tax=Typha latifolia TaxID=4733 RepID=UPI003C2EABF5